MKNALLLISSLGLAAAVQAAPKIPQPYSIAPLKSIKIDGLTDDWNQSSMGVDVLTDLNGKVRSRLDSSAPLRIGYDERGIIALVLWRDDVFQEAGTAENLWQKDSLELFVANKVGGTEMVQIMVGSGRDPKFPTPRVQIVDKRQNAAIKATPLQIQTGILANNRGTTVEVLIPWADLGLTPTKGTAFGFQLIVNDVDTGERQQMLWFPQTGTSSDSSKMVALKVAEKADATVRVAATGNHERFRRVNANIVTFPVLEEQTVEVRDGKRVLGRGTITALSDGYGGANIKLPMPPRGQSYGPLHVRVGKEREVSLALPNIEKARTDYIKYAPVKFDSFVFTGINFPNADFEQPSVMEDALGPYSISTTFYDADYNLVKTAEKSGRYGALVQIVPESGELIKKYITLYRQPKEFDWRLNKPVFTAALPSELGIAPEVLSERGQTLSDYMMGRFTNGFSEDSESASLLAGLSETKTGEGSGAWNSPWSRDEAWRFGLMKKLGDTKPLPYLLDLPKDYEVDKTKKWPLVLFLHGSGERGEDLNKVRAHGPPMLVAQGKDFPFILASPQAPTGGFWLQPQLMDLLDEVEAKYRVDVDRVYVTGLSMGGSGTFYLAWEHPERFAAIAPMASGGDPASSYRLKGLPTWFFVGGKDGTVPERANKTAAAMKEVGVPLKYTLYPEADHGQTWKNAYSDPAFYEWLLAQKRGQ